MPSIDAFALQLRLSCSQAAIFAMLVQGLSRDAIADRRGCCRSTVDEHCRRICLKANKLGIVNPGARMDDVVRAFLWDVLSAETRSQL